ncbi:hypothetical protein JHK84_044880 [Glycine max]|nr:hypothetical protein JHK84_044880 [Glycine max]
MNVRHHNSKGRRYLGTIRLWHVEKLGKDSLFNCAKTSMSSKLIAGDNDFFAILEINILKARGKSARDSFLMNGYASNIGHAAQGMPLRFLDPKRLSSSSASTATTATSSSSTSSLAVGFDEDFDGDITHHSPTQVLKNFNEIRLLRIELPNGDNGSIPDSFYTNGGLKLYIIWTISSLIAACATRHPRQLVAHGRRWPGGEAAKGEATINVIGIEEDSCPGAQHEALLNFKLFSGLPWLSKDGNLALSVQNHIENSQEESSVEGVVEKLDYKLNGSQKVMENNNNNELWNCCYCTILSSLDIQQLAIIHPAPPLTLPEHSDYVTCLAVAKKCQNDRNLFILGKNQPMWRLMKE